MINFGDNNDLLMKEEPLHPDLEGHVRTGTALGAMIHHPLVITPLYSRTRCALVNGLYAQKLTQLGEAAMQNDFHRMVMLYERPYRFDGLQAAIKAGLDADRAAFWSVVGTVWTDSENIYENFTDWQKLWATECSMRHLAMTTDDRAAFSKLKQRFRVYRGHAFGGTRLGMSWTTNREKAVWFAHRFAPDYTSRAGSVTMGFANKADILAYFTGRNEHEVVIDPTKLEKVEYTDI